MELREAEQAVAEVVEFVEQFRAELGRSERRRNCSQYLSVLLPGNGNRLNQWLSGLLAVMLWVDQDNRAAITLYRSLGFQHIGSCYTGYFSDR